MADGASQNMAGTLELEAVEIRLGQRLLLGIDASIGPGEVLTVMGPSGSGKSTLLAFIAGFLDPAFSATGSIRLQGSDITRLQPNERRIGMLFQDALLFPHMSVGGNLCFAMAPEAASDRTERRKQAEAALVEAGLEGCFDRDPATLSGGQQQRVALMRVLLSRPKALLLDEPFSRLDRELRGQIRGFVLSEARLYRLPVLLVTHDEEDALAAGGTIVRLDG